VDDDDNDEESYVSENTRLAEDTARERRLLRALGGDEADSGTDSIVEDVYEVDGDDRVYNVNMLQASDDNDDNSSGKDSTNGKNHPVLLWDTGAARHLCARYSSYRKGV
jgi:hypothetical protein